jgi:hypothetical protein
MPNSDPLNSANWHTACVAADPGSPEATFNNYPNLK